MTATDAHASDKLFGMPVRALGGVSVRRSVLLGGMVFVLLIFALLGSPRAGSVTDNFDDEDLDLALWETETQSPGVADGSVAETGGVIELRNAGVLRTTQDFVPTAGSPVVISFDFDIPGSRDLIKVTTRTSGGRTGSSANAPGGIQVVLHSPGLGGAVRINTLDSNGDRIAEIAFADSIVGSSGSAVIVDDGASVSVSVDGGSTTVGLSMLTTGANRVSFRNRENVNQVASIDNVGIDQMLDLDSDGDGVNDGFDYCPATTIPELSVPSSGKLGTNRWVLQAGDSVFDTTSPKGRGPQRWYDTVMTGGCSCEQIIEEQGLGKGHSKFGCSISAMDDWIDSLE